jgi:rare lipoprotein A
VSLRCSREPSNRTGLRALRCVAEAGESWFKRIRRPSIALFLVLQIPVCAQEEDRKPSPFPDKNREREAAARRSADASRRKREAGARSRTETSDRVDPTASQGASVGKACFFSLRRGSPLTASGVDAEANDFVAAHATYAFGSRVMVTNLANGRTVEVRITDRLPDPRRIISVNEAAARQLGFYDAGTADVRVEAVRPMEARR